MWDTTIICSDRFDDDPFGNHPVLNNRFDDDPFGNYPVAILNSFCTSATSTLETYYSNFIARQLYAQKCLKYNKIQYWILCFGQPLWRALSLIV